MEILKLYIIKSNEGSFTHFTNKLQQDTNVTGLNRFERKESG